LKCCVRFNISKIYRSGPDTLCIKYPYHIGEFHKHPDGYEYSANQGFWHIRAVVDINKRSVTSWEVEEGSGGLEPAYPHPVKFGDFQAIYGDFRESIHITGPGVDTRIWPAGRVIWLAAGKRHIIAGTNKGRVYLVEVPATLTSKNPHGPVPTEVTVHKPTEFLFK
jgi:hypothetical protein